MMKSFLEHLQKTYWDENPNTKLSGLRKALRIAVQSIKGFITDNCSDKASNLTYYSLLSIIPLLAVSFGIGQALGFNEILTEQIHAKFASQPEVADKIIEFSNSTLKETKGGVIASFGLVFLIWTVMNMIGKIASSFDEIWRVKEAPSFLVQAKRYLPMIFLFPILIVAASSMLLLMSSQAILAFKSLESLQFLASTLSFLLHLLPYVFGWAVLSFLYIYLPNRKVSWRAGIIAGLITSFLFIGWQWIYVTFQLHASSYGAIYGGFAAFPLFLIWVNYSWLIVLFGTELTQHIHES